MKRTSAILLAAALYPACEAPPPPRIPLPPPGSVRTLTEPAPDAPTVEGARRFLASVDSDLRRLWVARDRAGWAYETNLTDDTEAIATAAEEATAEYITRTIGASRRFDGLPLPAPLARQMALLRLAQTVPAPSDPALRAELARLQTEMRSAYAKGEVCQPQGKCQKLQDLEKTLRTSRDPATLLEAWRGWHTISIPMKPKFSRYVELANQGAREIAFADLGVLWRSGYDMPAETFEADVARLWNEVRPLYEKLHCYVRARLRARYGPTLVPDGKPIPAHLLGNMWAQEWLVYDLVEPYKGEPSLDVGKKLLARHTTPVEMVKLGERFFTSLGFDPLPPTFWTRSLFTRPKDREVVCHASAWDVQWNGDLRIKMCIEPTEEDLVTIHHELGHDFYFQRYDQLPMLFQSGANDGFHEGIGDTLALSVTPKYLVDSGLLDAAPKNDRGRMNQQMKMALDKIAFLPFGLLIDQWRWDVFSGKTPKERYNDAWWDLRTKLQGVSMPSPRTEEQFDAGAKFHIPSSTPYVRYFLARIYQFQFHRALCRIAGHTGPLDTCSIYGSKEAGQRLIAMMSLGASKPWPEALTTLSGERAGDASALLEYFAPLRQWLDAATKAETCGW